MHGLLNSIKTTLLVIFFACTIQGCAQMNAYAQATDCQSCHVTQLAPGAQDYSDVYANPSIHHPANIQYPTAASDLAKFKQPDQRIGNIAFFDRNGNGQADIDEVQLFASKGALEVACASCHRQHGTIPPTSDLSVASYLRVDNIGSALCLTCHNN